MKKFLLTAFILSIIVSGIASASVIDTDKNGYITVSTSTYKEIQPDTAELSIEIKTFDTDSIQIAAVKNNEISGKVYSAVMAMINTDNGDYIKTTDFNVSPKYIYSEGKKQFDKYQVVNSIIVKTKNIRNMGAIIDKVLSFGNVNIKKPEFTVSDYDEQCNELLSEAAQKAGIQANTIAHSMSSSVKGIKSITASCGTNKSSRINYNFSGLKTTETFAGLNDETPVESGKVKIYANINASFFTK